MSKLQTVISTRQNEILEEWNHQQNEFMKQQRRALPAAETLEQTQQFLHAFALAVRSGSVEDIQSPAWSEARRILEDLSHKRGQKGFTPSEVATFIFSLKRPILEALRQEHKTDAEALAKDVWVTTELLDQLGLYTITVYQKARDAIIARQQQEMLELSTPVVQLWRGVLALPLIGTLDSERTQVVMENLLQKLVETGAGIAIIDITGVPTVDTLVAQHLLKTVAAARLMGAECFISGIRPQIAQTIVHLGVELNVVSKATLADAFATALAQLGLTVQKAAARQE
jgi:rsbT co-antagonist protein RsbR